MSEQSDPSSSPGPHPDRPPARRAQGPRPPPTSAASPSRAPWRRPASAGDQVDYVIMGQVILAGAGQNPARTAGIAGGLPMNVPSITINKVCLSGLNAIAMADQLIRAGEVEIVVAGGMESMTNAPHLLPKSREGFKYGDTTLVDSMAYDALLRPGHPAGDGRAHRAVQRRRAATSPARSRTSSRPARTSGPPRPGRTASSTTRSCRSTIPQRKGDPVVVTHDEGVRGDTTAESLGKLRPAFGKDGTITAGSASQISDGAAAVVVMSKAKAEELGLEWLAEIGAHGMVAGPDSSLQLQPANATAARPARRRASRPPTSTWSSSTRPSRRSASSRPARSASTEDKVNVNGGAIALGHPVGMSGARVVLHLALELKRRGGGVGAAALCGGGGQGDALIVRVPAS